MALSRKFLVDFQEKCYLENLESFLLDSRKHILEAANQNQRGILLFIPEPLQKTYSKLEDNLRILLPDSFIAVNSKTNTVIIQW